MIILIQLKSSLIVSQEIREWFINSFYWCVFSNLKFLKQFQKYLTCQKPKNPPPEFSLPTIQELQAQAVLFFSRKMNLFPWNTFVSEGSFWCCLPLSSCDARKLQQGRPSICKSETMGNEVVLRKLKRKIHARWGYLSMEYTLRLSVNI